jgi:hypothetical protein
MVHLLELLITRGAIQVLEHQGAPYKLSESSKNVPPYSSLSVLVLE